MARPRPPAGRAAVPLLTLAVFAAAAPPARSQPDLFIRDTPADTGVEPNPDPGPMWVSPDIWVRNSPDPNYNPRPFPTAAPTWAPQPHENPEYDDPKTGFPAYVYVRVHNRGRSPTAGTERLRVYWAKASTGLGWPAQWVDYVDSPCGTPELHGMEITKPRRNAQAATAAERSAFRDALLDIQTNPARRFSDGVPYWRKQDTIHATGGAQHGVPAFFPWHREMVNRFETLLRESNPRVTLLYWDWTSDPRVGTNLFTTGAGGFMGSGSGTVGAPLVPLRPPTLSRNVGFSAFSPDSDATVLAEPNFPSLRTRVENVPNHNSSHGFIGGPGGQISFPSISAQDPFFFLLHGNVDRLWAQWQRNPTQPARLDPATAYGAVSGHASLTGSMGPWNGATGVAPWTNPSEQYVKTSAHPSVVSPPVYDTAPLTVPVLQPNQSVVVQVPWFPPDPARFGCFGDPGHFCLLARVETAAAFPFGMATPEGMNVDTNTRNNNNIAWKNVTVVDSVSRLRFLSGAIVRNFLPHPAVFRLRVRAAAEDRAREPFAHGTVTLSVPPRLGDRWRASKAIGEGVEVAREAQDRLDLRVKGDGSFLQVELRPGDSFPVEVAFEAGPQFPAELRRKPFAFDLEQVAVARGFSPETTVGGVRVQVDASKLTLVPRGSRWTKLDGADPPADWAATGFDDRRWRVTKAPLHSTGRRHGPTYLRRSFTVDDPAGYDRLSLRVLADDGAVVFLNGKEVYRRNLPAGPVGADAVAGENVDGLREHVYWASPVDPKLLAKGENTLAVAVVQSKDGADDLHFDLELSAPPPDENLPPEVRIRRPAHGAQFVPGEAVEVVAEALDQDGKVERVQFFVDGARAGAAGPKLRLDDLRPGSHQVTVEAVDAQGARSSHSVRVSVTPDLPPLVRIASPKDGARVGVGKDVEVLAEVLDARAAEVVKVELFVREGDTFLPGFDLARDPAFKPVAVAKKPPYRLAVPPLRSGMYMLQVGATDAAGNVGTSSHVMLHVTAH